ncbi:hypothetical protein LX36DRAFT_461376 [Colletotrichum falcatum]|nr:hypothetical protein LX36DRAFT_461376 [Colletotrichum falcatum]
MSKGKAVPNRHPSTCGCFQCRFCSETRLRFETLAPFVYLGIILAATQQRTICDAFSRSDQLILIAGCVTQSPSCEDP